MEKEKKEKTIAVRLTEDDYNKIQEIVTKKYINGSTLGRVLFSKFLKGEIEI